MLSNNFSYTKLASAFVTQKDFYYVHDDSDGSFFFFFRKVLLSFECFFFELLFSVIIVIYLKNRKNVLKKLFISFFDKNCICWVKIYCFNMLEKLSLVYESCKIYELSKLYELCKLCEYLMNYLKSLQIAWNQSKKLLDLF